MKPLCLAPGKLASATSSYADSFEPSAKGMCPHRAQATQGRTSQLGIFGCLLWSWGTQSTETGLSNCKVPLPEAYQAAFAAPKPQRCMTPIKAHTHSGSAQPLQEFLQPTLWLGGRMTPWLQEVRHIVTAVCPRFSRQAHDIFMLQPPAGCCMLPVACRQAVPQNDLLHYAALAVGTNPARFGKLKHP